MRRTHLSWNGTSGTALVLALCLTLGSPVQIGAQSSQPAQEQPERSKRTAAPMLRIVVVEGEGALNNIALKQGKDPSVRVEDDDARPVPNATVSFVLPVMGAGATFGESGTSVSVTTDAQGLATARNLRPNNIAGQFQIRVTASHAGTTATAVINQTNAAPRRPTAKKNGKLLLILGLAGGGGAVAALALRGGGGGQAATPAPITGGTVVVPGSPVFGPPR